MKAFEKIKNTGLILFIAITANMFLPTSALAQEGSPTIYVKVKVDGLSCPFCAYGLEKNLKKKAEAKDIFISVAKGYATFRIAYEKLPSKSELVKIVEDAGFTAREVLFSKMPFEDEDER